MHVYILFNNMWDIVEVFDTRTKARKELMALKLKNPDKYKYLKMIERKVK